MKRKTDFNREVLRTLGRSELFSTLKKRVDYVKLHQRHTKAGVMWVQLCKECQKELKVFDQHKKLYERHY